MVDIHSHILPFVDDGSRSVGESIDMLKAAVDAGITDIIATPHYCPERGYTATIPEIKEAYNKLLEEVTMQSLPINIYLGQEIFYFEYDNILPKIESGGLMTLNNTKYVLLEFSMLREPRNLSEAMYTMSVRGYTPIIAHVERYKWMTLDIMTELKSAKCLLQVNASSFSAIPYKKKCKKLLKKGFIDIIASDIHAFRNQSYKNFHIKGVNQDICEEIIK